LCSSSEKACAARVCACTIINGNCRKA